MTFASPQHAHDKTSSGTGAPGDPTLVGTQLQVITQREADGGTAFKFQITSAVGLDGQANELLGYFKEKKQEKAVALLEKAAGKDTRFVKMMKAAFDKGFAPMPDQERGRDGFPNFRTIFDAADPPTETFQVHTVLDIVTPDGPTELATAISSSEPASIEPLVTRHCRIVDSAHVHHFLNEALKP